MVRKAGFRIQDSGFRRLLWNLIPALPLCCLLVAGIIKAQMPANTPVFSVNAKWVTDRGSQVYNVTAYGAKGDGVTDDSGAFASALAALPSTGGTLLIPPSGNSYVLSSARLAVLTSNVLISAYGATLLCTVSDDCVTLGSLSNPTANQNIAVRGLMIEPGAGSVGHSAIRYNTQGATIEDVNFLSNGSYKFNHLIENDDDQGSTLRHIYVNGGGIRCDSTFCGSVIWGPGPYSMNAGITYLSDFSFSPECSGNGIDWSNGNELAVSNGVIQGYSQFSIRIGSLINGTANFHQLHSEVGSCTNPLGNVGQAGIIDVGTTISVFGGQIGGYPPRFPQAGTAGTTNYVYYVLGHHSGRSTGPLPAGFLTNGNATINATNNITVSWNDFAASGDTYDVLRYFNTAPRTAPYGTGNWAVATGLAESSVCASGVCTFVDTVTSPSSFTVPSGWSWEPIISMWPGSIVLSPGYTNNCNYAARYYGDSFGLGGAVITNVCGLTPGTVNLLSGLTDFSGDALPFGPGYVTMLNLLSANGPASTLLLPMTTGGLKGTINLGSFGGYGDGLTLSDSAPSKTLSSIDHHPSYDTGDTALCFDGSASSVCTRAASSISNYINSLPDGKSWVERLTTGVKTFRVPLNGFSVPQLSSPGGIAEDQPTGGTLSPNTQYCYRAAAVDSLGTTPPGSEFCVITANDGNNTHAIVVLAGSQALAGGYQFYGRTTGAEQLMTPTPVTNTYPTYWTIFADTGSVTPSGAMPTSNTTGQVKPALYSTATNCSSSASPAVCGSASAGSFVIAASATSVVVDTTAVTANSQILLTEDSSLGTKLSVTCNTQSLLTLGVPKVTARTAGTSFTASIEVGPTTNPLCISYAIFN